MSVKTSAVHRVAKCLLGAFTLALVGCDDQDSVTTPKAVSDNRAVVSVVSGGPGEWDRVSGDLTISIENKEGIGFPGQSGKRTMHVDRVRQPDSSWHTTYTIPEERQANLINGNDQKTSTAYSRVSKIEMDEQGQVVQMYDRKGARIQVPDKSRLEALHKKYRSPKSYDESLHKSPQLGKPAGGSKMTSHDWINGLIVSATSQDRASRNLKENFGASKGKIGNRSRYVRAAGDTVTEVLVDPDAGMPNEVSVTAKGKVINRQIAVFTKIRDSIYARTSVHVTQAVPGRDVPMTVHAQWSNLKFTSGAK